MLAESGDSGTCKLLLEHLALPERIYRIAAPFRVYFCSVKLYIFCHKNTCLSKFYSHRGQVLCRTLTLYRQYHHLHHDTITPIPSLTPWHYIANTITYTMTLYRQYHHLHHDTVSPIPSLTQWHYIANTITYIMTMYRQYHHLHRDTVSLIPSLTSWQCIANTITYIMTLYRQYHHLHRDTVSLIPSLTSCIVNN
jgi:hypothetical protein